MSDFDKEELDRAIALSIAEADEIEKGKKVVGKSAAARISHEDSCPMVDCFNLFFH